MSLLRAGCCLCAASAAATFDRDTHHIDLTVSDSGDTSFVHDGGYSANALGVGTNGAATTKIAGVTIVTTSSTTGRAGYQTSYDSTSTKGGNMLDGDETTPWESAILPRHEVTISTDAEASAATHELHYDPPLRWTELGVHDREQWAVFDLGGYKNVRAIRIHASGDDDTPYECSLQVASAPHRTPTALNLLATANADSRAFGIPWAGEVSASRTALDGDSAPAPLFKVANAFDGNPSTKWVSCLTDCYRGAYNKNPTFPGAVGYGDAFPVDLDTSFAKRVLLEQYQVLAYVQDPTETDETAAELMRMNPSRWDFLGSNDDGGTWTVLDQQSAQAFDKNVPKLYPLTAKAALVSYSKFRLRIHARAGVNADGLLNDYSKASVSIADVELRSRDIQEVPDAFQDVRSFSLQRAAGWQTFGAFARSGRFFRLKVKNNYGFAGGSVDATVRVNELEFLA
jgi:hypothetical protein